MAPRVLCLLVLTAGLLHAAAAHDAEALALAADDDCASVAGAGASTCYVDLVQTKARAALSSGEAAAGVGTVKLTYPEAACPAGFRAMTQSECQGADGYNYQGGLRNDGNWVDGCFEWYSNRNGQNENTKKVYFNDRAGADTGGFGGNRLCIEATLPRDELFPEFRKLQYPDASCPEGYAEMTEGQCAALSGHKGLAYQRSMNNDGNWVGGCFEWYSKRNDVTEGTKKIYYNNRPGATKGNWGGNKMCKMVVPIECDTCAGSCAGVSYKPCHFWGDPHFTETFSGARFDKMGLGPYLMAQTREGCFELQNWQCPYYGRVTGASVNSAVAIKMGGKVVTIIKDEVSVDGRVMTSGFPAGISKQGTKVSVSSDQGCHCFSLTTDWKIEDGDYTMDVNLRLDEATIDMTKGVCVGGGAGRGLTPLASKDSLFSGDQAKALCEHCGMDNCEDWADPIVPPLGWPEDPTAETMCAAAGVSFEEASVKCRGEAFFNECLVEYCGSLGDDAAIEVVKAAEAEEAETTPGPTPGPPPGPTPGPSGTCTVYGDPHVVGFDDKLSLLEFGGGSLEQQGSVAGFGGAAFGVQEHGDVWLVKSPLVHVQGRFNAVRGANNKKASFLRSIAVGGPFLEGHALVLGVLGQKITWKGSEILPGLPSEFSDGLISAKYHHGVPLVQAPGQEAQAPGIEVALPLGVKLLLNRGTNGLGVAVTMPREAGQDGFCGNFNGAHDDTAELVSQRVGHGVSSGELLFGNPFASTPQEEMIERLRQENLALKTKLSKAGKNQDEDEDDEKPAPKKGKEGKDEDEDDEKPAPKKGKKGKQDDSDDNDEEEPAAEAKDEDEDDEKPAPKKGKKGKHDDSDDDEEEEPAAEAKA